MKAVTMYVGILSSALDEWGTELTGSALIDHVLACRAEMLHPYPYRRDSAYTGLADEIAYDRALISLCTERGIDVVPTGFAHRHSARAGLEQELASSGVDLADLAGRRNELQA
jgi:hypothetical protein